VKIEKIHSWDDITISDAKQLQRHLASMVKVEGDVENVKVIAAGDLAFSKNGVAYAAVVVLSYPSFERLELYTGTEDVRFPYIPGYLSFREAPLLLNLFEKMSIVPDLVMIDGQGIAHPRRLGLAAHIGLFLKIPTIGVAKSRLIGDYDEPGIEKGAWNWMYHKGERIGMVVRTRRNVKPIFISPGYGIGFESSLDWVLKCAVKYRIPVPTRMAHIEVTKFKMLKNA